MAEDGQILAARAEFPAPAYRPVANNSRECWDQCGKAENPGGDSIDRLSGCSFVQSGAIRDETGSCGAKGDAERSNCRHCRGGDSLFSFTRDAHTIICHQNICNADAEAN